MKRRNLAWMAGAAAGTVMLVFMIGLHREEQKIQQEIAASVVRFHVKANSDTRKDQDNKLAVRDALLEKMEELLDENSDPDKEETEKILRRHLPELETCAEKVLRERNCSQSVEVSFGESWFPQKTYGEGPPSWKAAFFLFPCILRAFRLKCIKCWEGRCCSIYGRRCPDFCTGMKKRSLFQGLEYGDRKRMSIDNNAPIGVFDSGVGGLTVVREIMRNLPDERIVYFGDTARVPYGSKSADTVIRYSRQIVRFLQTRNVKAIVIACNTASALALETIEKEIDLPILGVVKPGAEMALQTTKNKKIGVIATEGTIHSGLYQRLISQKDPEVTVYGQPCPLFVPLVEEGWTKDPITEEVARRYLKDLLGKDIDTLIMGCTHYPLLRSLLRQVVGEKVTLVNPAYETSQALKRMLAELKLERDPSGSLEEGKYCFYASDAVERLNEFARRVLPYEIVGTRQIQIEEY